MTDYGKLSDAKRDLVAQIARDSGVAEDEVSKVLGVLGIDNHLEEAVRLLGAAPTLPDLLLGFHVSESTVMV